MRKREIRIGLLAIATVVAGISLASQGQVVAITRVNVVDVTNGEVASNRTVVVTATTITNISEGVAPPRNAIVVDGRGKFLIPGLWDMHAHLEAVGAS